MHRTEIAINSFEVRFILILFLELWFLSLFYVDGGFEFAIHDQSTLSPSDSRFSVAENIGIST